MQEDPDKPLPASGPVTSLDSDHLIHRHQLQNRRLIGQLVAFNVPLWIHHWVKVTMYGHPMKYADWIVTERCFTFRGGFVIQQQALVVKKILPSVSVIDCHLK